MKIILNKFTLSKKVISSSEGNFLFCPVVSRRWVSLTFEILFVIVKRFFFVIPGDFNDETDRLFALIAGVVVVVVRFGDNGWDISSLVVVDDTTENDEDVGNDDDTVLFIIIRGAGLDTITGFVGGIEVLDEDNKISDIEFVRSLKKKKKKINKRNFIAKIYCWLLTSIR